MPPEIQKLNEICFWLIHQCRETGAEEMKIEQKNVTFKGEKLGTWEISVKKI